ncbi:thioredoxin domain-containing protein [Paenibacillus chondroitinus]|uniref:Thioredoxin domain-containing protein n=2 Tax=Paenibacillus TaxID=44249 RepID=A0ABU6DEX9_9BACL|nr:MULTISPECIES: thioredoxin domain-containing protein [Paenibacillus]MCY9657311.1 thioredoxin domain-containing protein [Paenibacillus anseongense]MEB4795950.1 thioredoxin domain-containing protein [Paenibacillus chondroitinus]
MSERKSNALINEKSPYLLQHAYNPVEWFPWSEEAFEKAKQENKPIFLSIGYSTCHWCHVMAHESFEDQTIADMLNKDFISIKVDREERPDIDHIYMAVCQAMTGQGGWPLTVFLTPEKKPFFAGTYFPRSRKYNRAGMVEILAQLSAKWREDAERVREVGEQIIQETTARLLEHHSGGELTEETLHEAFRLYESSFDPEFGGFGNAPKFPTSHNLSFLLRYYKKTGNERALAMVEKTLDAMHRGGMYDHIGFGFSRYSVDSEWLVPHFEKMLYDNALLLMTYVEAYQVTDKAKYAEVAEQIITYVLRDMTDVGGAFYSAEDADSEGEEGKFYVWTADEVELVLGIEEGDLFSELFDITESGNFEGHNIPNLIQTTPASFAKRKRIPLDQLKQRMEEARVKLFEHREKRIHPGKDDKILTAWNGLMIAALSKAARALDKPAYAEAAAKAADFLLRELRREDGRLLARYRDGEAAFPGYVDDYAFLVWGLIELYETTFELRYLREAVQLNAEMLRLFGDEERGGLFFYGSDAEQLLTRPKEIYDGAMPSGNAAAALNMQRLAKLTYDAKLSQAADEQLQAFAGAVASYPPGHALMLAALDFAYSEASEIVIAGDPAKPETQHMLRAVQRQFLPNALLILHPPGAAGEEVRKLIPLVQDKLPLGGRATAYVCQNFACQAPTQDLEDIENLSRIG